MNVKDTERLNTRQLETLKRKFERETQRLERGHEAHKTELKKTHEEDILNLRHENLSKVNHESDKKEKILQQMRLHLDDTKRLTVKQIEELAQRHSEIKAKEHDKLQLELETKRDEHELYMDDMHYRYNQQTRKVLDDGRKQLEEIKSIKQQEIADSGDLLQGRLQKQTSEFTTRFQNDSSRYQKMKDTQDIQFKKERAQTNARQQVDMAKLVDSHNHQLEVRDKVFRQGVKSQDLLFEKTYADHLKTQNDSLKGLNDLHERVVSKMKMGLKDQLEFHVARSDDPFYKFTELKPTLKQFEDRVEITVEIPEHSKEDISLSLNNKEAILTFNRRYDDSRREAGITNKLHKVESFTSRLTTSHVLDPKTVKSHYDNGVMTYVVKRA